MNVKLNNKGFSLVELMVVVAIIGILAAVAVPQFSKFQAKSRQSEAKSSLTAIYTAEKGFNAEYSGYATAFQAIGYAPAGEVLYDVGFVAACANWAACAPEYEPNGAGTAPVLPGAAFAASGFCTAYGAAMVNNVGCRMKQAGALASGTVGPLALAGAANTATQVTFQATANAVVYSGFTTNSDTWTINQNKVILQTAQGIP